jgi:hypothetical protein
MLRPTLSFNFSSVASVLDSVNDSLTRFDFLIEMGKPFLLETTSLPIPVFRSQDRQNQFPRNTKYPEPERASHDRIHELCYQLKTHC